MYDFVTIRVSEAAITAFRWLEWMDHHGRPCIQLVCWKFAHKEICSTWPDQQTYSDEIHSVSGRYCWTKIKESLPATFGLVVDGWTCNKEHYFAIFASYTDANSGVVKLPLSRRRWRFQFGFLRWILWWLHFRRIAAVRVWFQCHWIHLWWQHKLQFQTSKIDWRPLTNQCHQLVVPVINWIWLCYIKFLELLMFLRTHRSL
jgi:hypothetical protein